MQRKVFFSSEAEKQQTLQFAQSVADVINSGDIDRLRVWHTKWSEEGHALAINLCQAVMATPIIITSLDQLFLDSEK